MRIVIAGTQKSGNVWLKCVLANVYDLRVLRNPEETPERPRLDAFQTWIGDGGFPDGTIFHHHFPYSPAMADAIEAVPAKIVTIVRDPYDSFVSYYHSIQNRNQSGHRRDVMAEQPIDHPDVLHFLREGGYRRALRLAKGWAESGRSSVVRYEDLHRDPIGLIVSLRDALGGRPSAAADRAIQICRAENMQSLDFVKPGHIRAAKVGDSRERLSDEHLAIFRDKYADLIAALGYEVR
ncbi:MAG TPA: sulfotransferase domain-containing protein [Thermomicrobiales bacterium]|nr:sulfotransferase domain-containing protein [Thermomicrobiales bacterium]